MQTRIRDIRMARGMTQAALASSANVSQPYLYDLERGARGAKDETLARIADALGVSVEELRDDTVSDHSADG